MMTVLLLNADYTPLTIVSTRRAVSLLLSQRAEVIEELDGEIRSAKTSIAMPSVVRLMQFVFVPYRKFRAPYSKRGVLARDGFECQFRHCDRVADTVDHVLPRAQGGISMWENVVASCFKCNQKKGKRSLSEMGWTLKREPKAPKAAIAMRQVRARTIHPTWEPYLQLAA